MALSPPTRMRLESKIVGSKPIHCVHNLPIKNKKTKKQKKKSFSKKEATFQT